MKTNPAMSALRHHVTGAIARGEAQAITEVPALHSPAYTPGPWAALIEGESLQGSETHLVAVGPHCMAVAEVPMSADARTSGRSGKTTITAAQGRANARLIAAAPELIEALEATEAKLTQAARAFYGAGSAKALREAFEGWRTTSESARAAIAKARG